MDKKTKKLLYAILFGGELSLVFVAVIILSFRKQSFISIFSLSQNPNVFTLFLLILCAIFIAISIVYSVIKIPLFIDIKKIIDEIITGFNLNTLDIFLISLLAGICEEILFRGVLQPMLGLWLTSFLFILLHGYFNPFNWRMSVFGILMFCLSIIIGIIYIKYGLISAIVFHFFYDFTAFLSFIKFSGTVKNAA